MGRDLERHARWGLTREETRGLSTPEDLWRRGFEAKGGGLEACDDEMRSARRTAEAGAGGRLGGKALDSPGWATMDALAHSGFFCTKCCRAKLDAQRRL